MKRITLTVVILSLMALGAGPASAQSGHDLFQQALLKERAEGELQEAIQLYEQIVRDFAADRTLAARALVQVGQCYEKLGSQEAERAYQRVVNDYGDQAVFVAQARERLAALRPAALRSEQVAPSPVSPATRLISDGWPQILRTPLRDGRHLLDYDTARSAFDLVDIQSGTTRPLLTTESKLPFMSGGPGYFDLSADGRTVAGILVVHDAAPGEVGPVAGVELRVFDVGGNGAGRLAYSWGPGHYVKLFGWVPDASSVWTFVLKPDRTAQIASVDLTDGAFNVLKTLDYRGHSQPPSISPDGRLITYHDAPDRESPPDVFLLATDGSREIRVEHPASDSKPIFAPDGSGIVFESDRRGARDLWFLPVADGRPSGAPRIVWRDVGYYGVVLRFAENGSLFYYFSMNERAVYTAEIDVLNQTIDNLEVVTPRQRQMNSAPAWSPDGRWLAYLRGGSRLVMRELATGVEREVTIPGGRGPVDWCGSATSLVVSGYDDGPAAYRVGQGSGEVERLPLNRPDRALCVAEGEAIVYHRRVGDRSGQVGQVVRHFLSSGQESVLFEGGGRSMARSLDGRHLAFIVADSVVARLVVMPSTGGEPRELMTSSYYEYPGRLIQRWAKLIDVAWMPDGQHLLVVKSAEDPAEGQSYAVDEVPYELWRVPIDGGAAQMIGRLPEQFKSVRSVRDMSVHPDGTRLAFGVSEGWVMQVWAIENLLQHIHADGRQ